MSGWRIGFAVAAPSVMDAIGKLINTSASCSPPFAQEFLPRAIERDERVRRYLKANPHYVLQHAYPI
jgi:aspartate aminotransferase